MITSFSKNNINLELANRLSKYQSLQNNDKFVFFNIVALFPSIPMRANNKL